jgi:anti-sigma regulatory factor (Ser/Thr protein kinase)
VNAPEVAPGSGANAADQVEVLRLPHRPEAVALARRTVRACLAERRVCDAAMDDAEVVVSELLGNAVRHARAIAGGVLVLGWQVRHGQLQVRVTDGGSGRVESVEADVTAVSGRGLHIVERLTTSWGVTDHAGGLRTVWATVSLDRPPTLRLIR